MPETIVMKFGGTSVADADAIRAVIEIVRDRADREEPLVVVVSAMARVTDALIAASEAARGGHLDDVERRVAALQRRHVEVIAELFAACPNAAPHLSRDVAAECGELRGVLTSVAILRELTPRGADRVAAAGELMSSRIVAAALQAAGVPARWVDARRTLVTDGRSPALPLATESRLAATRAIAPALIAGEVAVMGGFIGATVDGITTTLGRGGSDLSAAVIGAALDAREIQIWTDVDGMLTADPRVVAGAQLVPELSFEEASELAYFGAKVLHPSTILPAVEQDIPVRILNTMRPAQPGTVITSRPALDGRPLAAIACKRNVTVVDLTSTRMLLAHGFLRRVFEVFERHETSVDVVTTSEVSVSMTLDDDRRIHEIAHDLSAFATVRVEPGMAIVSAVGDQLQSNPLTAIRVIGALGQLPLRMVSQAASRRNVTVVVNDANVPAAMERLHAEFFALVATR